jgi:uncharacterized protein YqeY
MPLNDRIQKDLVDAMKAKDELRLGAIRMIKTALMKYKADQMKEADEAAEQQILNSLVKQRNDSIDMFRKGGREELALKEEQEKAIIESYLPAPATEEEVDATIAAVIAETGASSAKQMGAVMKAAQAKLSGKRVDGRALSEKVKARLT